MKRFMNWSHSLYEKNELYFKVLFYLSFIPAAVRQFFTMLSDIGYSVDQGQYIMAVLWFALLGPLSMLNGIIAGLFGAAVIGAILFIPYKLIQGLWRLINS